jgi:hypothetical protein
MPLFRVQAVREFYFETIVEADTVASAGVKVGDMIRAGELEPYGEPCISSIDVHRLPDRD